MLNQACYLFHLLLSPVQYCLLQLISPESKLDTRPHKLSAVWKWYHTSTRMCTTISSYKEVHAAVPLFANTTWVSRSQATELWTHVIQIQYPLRLFMLITMTWERQPQQLHKQHALLFLLSWVYSVLFFAVLFQQCRTLCHARFYVCFSPPLSASSFAGHFGACLRKLTLMYRRYLYVFIRHTVNTVLYLVNNNSRVVKIHVYFSEVSQHCSQCK